MRILRRFLVTTVVTVVVVLTVATTTTTTTIVVVVTAFPTIQSIGKLSAASTSTSSSSRIGIIKITQLLASSSSSLIMDINNNNNSSSSLSSSSSSSDDKGNDSTIRSDPKQQVEQQRKQQQQVEQKRQQQQHNNPSYISSSITNRLSSIVVSIFQFSSIIIQRFITVLRTKYQFIFQSRYSESKIRFEGNNISNTTSILSPYDAAKRVGIEPTAANIPASIWKLFYYSHIRLLPFLHSTERGLFQKYNITKICNNDLSLWVLWNKVIATMNYNHNRNHIWYDNNWNYDLLPPYTRVLLKIIPYFLFPKLYHTNIEIRTRYLNTIIENEIQLAQERKQKVRIIVLGCGYDIRGTKLFNTYSNSIEEVWELDIDDVIVAKRILLNRLQYRRYQRNLLLVRKTKKSNTNNVTTNRMIQLPKLRAINFNNRSDVQQLFDNEIFQTTATTISSESSSSSSSSPLYTIVISEAVMIYLNKTIPRQLITQCYQAVRKEYLTYYNNNNKYDDDRNNNNQQQQQHYQHQQHPLAAFCFADRLENCPGGDRTLVQKEFNLAAAAAVADTTAVTAPSPPPTTTTTKEFFNESKLMIELGDWFPRPGLARHMGLAHFYL